MLLKFEGESIYWRGPAPSLFVPVPAEPSHAIKAISSSVSYGWGVIPVRARIGGTEWTTSLFPRDGRYLVPIKVIVQEAEGLQAGDIVSLQLDVYSLHRSHAALQNLFKSVHRQKGVWFLLR